MNAILRKLFISGILSSVTLIVGCTQMPTEKQSVSDMRPQISFKANSENTQTARVLVDNLDVGAVGDFLEGKAAVRVLSGMHKITVTYAGSVLLDEKVYLGDGVNRSFILK